MGKPADRFRAVLKAVAADLRIEPTSDLCKHVATLRLARENMQVRLLAGERVDIKDLLALDEAIRRHLPERDPLTITVEYVPSLPKEPENSLPPLAESTPASGLTTDVPTGLQTASTPDLSPAESAPAENILPTSEKSAPAAPVAPMKVTHRDGVSASRFHSAVINGREIPPLRKEQPSIYEIRRTSPMSER
jgi:hypothetical protein